MLLHDKSPGSDAIPIELLTKVDEEAIKVLTATCQQIWIKMIWTKQWKESIYVPIPKKGDPRICSNNRTIALVSHASKVMLKVIQHRLDMYMKQEMAIEQTGITKRRGTRDPISNLRWIMERSTEYQRPIYMSFIDYSKAFYCVDHPTLWNTRQVTRATHVRNRVCPRVELILKIIIILLIIFLGFIKSKPC